MTNLTPSDRILTVFGKRVKEERNKKGITQEQLANYIYISNDTVKRIESGKGVNLDIAYNIAELLNVPLQALLPCKDVILEDELAERIKVAQDAMQWVLEKIQS